MRGLVLLVAGLLGLVGGMELFVEAGPVSGGVQADDLSGILSMAGGVVLVAPLVPLDLDCPSATAVASRPALRRGASRRWVPGWEPSCVVFPVGLGYFATHASGPGLTTAPDLGVPVTRSISSRATAYDLTAWYAASRNGAAVIVVPGTSGVDHARLLAEHGYGVLLLNRRGEADSEGDPNLFGWGGQGDIDGAIDFLSARADVSPGAVGALGLSVGGEVLLEHAATSSGWPPWCPKALVRGRSGRLSSSPAASGSPSSPPRPC